MSRTLAEIDGEGTTLNKDTVNQALTNEICTINLGTGQFYKGQIIVDVITIEYTFYGVVRIKVEILGAYRGRDGIFEYIIEPDGKACNHRLFVIQ